MPRNRESSSGDGYGRPPAHSRFKKGQSGNPKGRPPGSKNLTTQYLEEVNTPVPFTENGKRRMTTKLGATIKQQVTKAAGGDLRAVEKVLDRVAALEAQVAAAGARGSEFTAADREVIETIFNALKANDEKGEQNGGPTSGNV